MLRAVSWGLFGHFALRLLGARFAACAAFVMRRKDKRIVLRL
jgi:hypothetical protein